MNIELVNPPFLSNCGRYSRPSRSPAITKSGTVYYPILLATAGAVLEQAGHQVELVDACASRLDDFATLKKVIEFRPGITVLETSTPSIKSDLEFALSIKTHIPETFLVLVGPHATALDEEIISSNVHVDAIARGEYDYTLRDLAAALLRTRTSGENPETGLKDIFGLTFRSGANVVKAPDRPYITDLDALPFVTSFYKKHLDISKYNSSIAYNPMVMILAGRGCPSKCTFCVYPQQVYGNRYRPRSSDSIVAEFDFIAREMPEVRTIGIEDDTFTLSKSRILDFCQKLIDRKIQKRIKWWSNARVDCLELETMQIMKKAGCYMLIPGYESASPEILKAIRKGITAEQSMRFAAYAKKAGLLVHGCFIIGNIGESEKTARATIEFAKELNPDTAQFFPLMVSPGTEAYQAANLNHFLTTEDYSKWLTPEGLHNSVIDLPGLSGKRVMELCAEARREFYLRPSYLLKKIYRSIFSIHELKRNVRAFRSFVRHLVKKAHVT